MNIKTLIIVIILIVIGGGVIYYFSMQKEAGQEIIGSLKEIPSVSPFDKVVNPFRDLYKNPFK